MLTAYMDESGGKDTAYYVVAGYVGFTKDWIKFEKQWADILRRFGISALHMNEFAHWRGEFKGWSEKKRKALLKDLIELIQRSNLFPVSTSLPVKDFMELVAPLAPNSRLADPYFQCLQDCVVNAARHVDENANGRNDLKIDFVLDFNDDMASRAQSIFRMIRNSSVIADTLAKYIGSFAMADDKQVNPLQAADLLSYELLKMRGGRPRTPLRLLDSKNGAHFEWTRERLEGLAANLREGLNETKG